MNGNIDWELLTMYVFGECSARQEEEVEAWAAGDPVRMDILNDLHEVYGHTGKAPGQQDQEKRRQDQTWAQVEAHMQKDADVPPTTAGRPARPERISRRFVRAAPRVATVIAAVALLVLLVMQWLPGGLLLGPVSEAKAFATQRGERTTIRLTDGTRVRLNADSKLQLLPEFEAGVRKVRLQGQAYFEVAPDPDRPFLVQAGAATTEVLGTEFDVNAYSDSVAVVVAEGRVALRSSEAASREEASQGEIVLTSRQAARLSPGSQPVAYEVDVARQLAWLSGALVFDSAAFEEVARTLERRYDVEVNLAGPAARGQLTARFSEEQPLGKVLIVIASVFDLQYEREEKVVTFYPLGSRSS